MTTGTNPFTSASISGYNSSPPDDDGSQTSANRVSWSKHKTKLADPIKTLAESDISNTSAAFAKTINTDDGVKNLLDGSLAFGADELTIASGSVTADRSAHTIDTESDAATDDLSNIVGTSVYTGTILHLYAANSARQVVVKNEATGAGEIHTKDKADIVLSTEYPLILRYDGTDWYEIAHPAPSASKALNIADNGAMMVSQRGVNATILSSFDSTTNSYIADRWLASGGGTPQNRADLKHVSSGGPAGFPNFIRYDITTAEAAVAAGEYSVIEQRIEGYRCFPLGWGATGAKSGALSFYIRSPKTGTHSGYVYNSLNNRTWTFEFTVDAADTWEKKSVTIDPDTTGGAFTSVTTEQLRLGIPVICGSTFQTAAGTWTAGNYRGTSNQQNLADNTANNIDLTGVQLEVGSVATDFEHEDYGTTLAKCQRYYFRQTDASLGARIISGIANSDTACQFAFRFLVEMRAAPTLGVSNVTDFQVAYDATAAATTNVVAAVADVHSVRLTTTTASATTAGDAVQLGFDGGGTRWFEFSAEL
jgi:hypothetical protein